MIARAELDDGRVLKFIEPEPGVLIEQETGAADLPIADEPRGLSFVERYEFLTGKPAPEALVRAQQRSLPPGGLPNRDERSAAFDSRDKGKVNPAVPISLSDFRRTYCNVTDRQEIHMDTSLPWNWQDNGVNYFRAGVRSTLGLLWVTLNYNTGWARSSDGFSTWVPPGTYAALVMSSSVNATASISSGSGDGKLIFYDACWSWHY